MSRQYEQHHSERNHHPLPHQPFVVGFHAKRTGFALLRLALYSCICGIFFTVGMEMGRRQSNSSDDDDAASSLPKRGEDYGDIILQNEQIGQGVLPMPNQMMKPGEMGKPFILPKLLTDEQKRLQKEGWKNNGFNQYVSDLISVERSLPDVRHPKCKEPNRFLKSLPKTSVIIIFHNEAWSVILRSVHSVMSRSPPQLIKELILVDDCSTMDHLKDQLTGYMKKFSKVRIIRSPVRVGLIRARLLGADAATGKILTFLDSHIEATPGWLEPLLDRIARNFSTVVTPIIDAISDKTLEYMNDKSPPGSENRAIGIFRWNLCHSWGSLPDREKVNRTDTSEPYPSPTMAGGLFAISKRFFDYLGRYDPKFDIWGGENLELSFKTWMCGGRLEMVPCSHVGHIFRGFVPYKGREGVKYIQNNLVRLAKVWLDGFAKYYFNTIGNNLGDYGDILERVALRKRLNCKSFRWYLENVYPEIHIPDYGYAYGEIRNEAFGNDTCLDAPMGAKDKNKPIGLYPCHRQGGNQMWSFTSEHEIRREEMCVDFPGGNIVSFECHGAKGNQDWIYDKDSHQIIHAVSKKCMTMEPTKKNLTMELCYSNNEGQKWHLENYKEKLSSSRFDLV